jgi:hypothetical protein
MNIKNVLVLAAMSLFSIAITQSASAVEFITNGGFETGAFAPWTILSSQPAPVVSNVLPHSGTYDAELGDLAPPESNGDSSIYSNLTNPLPAGAMLSFYWYGFTTDSIFFDWQDAYITNASGGILATVMHNCLTTGGYLNVTFDLSAFAGQQVRVEFLDHEDGFGDVTYMRVDDVSVQGVPEPGVAWLGLLGFGALAAPGIARRIRRLAA